VGKDKENNSLRKLVMWLRFEPGAFHMQGWGAAAKRMSMVDCEITCF